MTFLVPCNSEITKSQISYFVVLSWPPHLHILLTTLSKIPLVVSLFVLRVLNRLKQGIKGMK